jgi:hypothetical protein
LKPEAAARLAEALPVTLWYFLDEDGLARCPDHDGPLFDAYCERCEAAHAGGPGPRRPEWIERGQAFLTRELAAVRRSAREGRMVPNRYATLDLGSDGLAYAASHRARLESPEFERWVELFCPPGSGHHASLEALEARVLCHAQRHAVLYAHLFELRHHAVGDHGHALCEQAVHRRAHNLQLVFDGKVDKVGVQQDVVGRAQRRVVREEHGRGQGRSGALPARSARGPRQACGRRRETKGAR